MARGISVHIGLNEVDSGHYTEGNGHQYKGELRFSLNDAQAMAALAAKAGYEVQPLLLSPPQTSAGPRPTAQAVLAQLESAVGALRKGDALLVTYSGHGGRVPSLPDDAGNETDGQDNTWFLYDRMLIDDELHAVWCRLEAGVRVFMLSDSCHSGTMMRWCASDDLSAPAEPEVPPKDELWPKAAPPAVAEATYAAHAALYRSVQTAAGASCGVQSRAGVTLVSACADRERAYECRGRKNSLFTAAVVDKWAEGQFAGSYSDFHARVKSYVIWAAQKEGHTQTPNLAPDGDEELVRSMLQGRPFGI